MTPVPQLSHGSCSPLLGQSDTLHERAQLKVRTFDTLGACHPCLSVHGVHSVDQELPIEHTQVQKLEAYAAHLDPKTE
jgi:hypothetical protein